jgi:hypothetical protein
LGRHGARHDLLGRVRRLHRADAGSRVRISFAPHRIHREGDGAQKTRTALIVAICGSAGFYLLFEVALELSLPPRNCSSSMDIVSGLLHGFQVALTATT